MAIDADLPGLELDRLAGWLDREHAGLRAGPLAGRLIAGGRSNLTYEVTDGTHRWAVRRPPLGHVLPTAHDMAREYRVITALGSTSVPVPKSVAYCADPEILGAQFYVMDFVAGVVLDAAADLAALSPEQSVRAGTELVDTLVELHAVDPAAVGLADFGRPAGFAVRQVKRWHSQWVASETRPVPEVAEVVELLLAQAPTGNRTAIVHGDYRMTNVIYSQLIDRVVAVVDWEMATLGDPLTDVGLLYLYHRMAESSDVVMPVIPRGGPFLTADELIARYGDRSGADLTDLRWYVAFGYFKFGAIAETIAARYRQGKTLGDGFEQFQWLGPVCMRGALELLRARAGDTFDAPPITV